MDLFECCRAFRNAIDACDKSKLSISFQSFPHGSCGDTSLLLARFLKGNGLGNFEYVCGVRDGWSHAWLEQGDTIIDITGDSSPMGQVPSMWAAKTTFIQAFVIDQRSDAHVEFDDDTMTKLDANYREIVRTNNYSIL